MLTHGWHIWLALLLYVHPAGASPTDTARLARTIDVAQGLPQSFTSGLVQDRQGFIWIGTRDGLARYDGRRFKIFNHLPGDTTTLADNIVSNLHYDRTGWLWILYESGKLDRLHTATEKLQHLSNQPFCRGFTNSFKKNPFTLNSFAEDDNGNVWLLAIQWGIYVFNISRNSLQYYNSAALHMPVNSISGLAKWGKKMVLITQNALVAIDAQCHTSQIIPYRFPEPWVNSVTKPVQTHPVVRKNGDIAFLNEGQFILYQPTSNTFTVLPLPPSVSQVYHSMVQDDNGDLFFEYSSIIYRLSRGNTLHVWANSNNAGNFNQSVCMLPDRSGMLWVGGNASPIRLYDRRLTHLQGRAYNSKAERFLYNVLRTVVGIDSIFVRSVLNTWPAANALRWAKWKDNTIWIAASGKLPFPGHTYLLKDGKLQPVNWTITGAAADTAGFKNINALAFSSTGRLWGVDYGLHPVLFNLVSHTATVYPAVPAASKGAKSLTVDGDSVLWLSTVADGFIRYSLATRQMQQYGIDEKPGSVAFDASILQQDPADPGRLWIGTMGDGLMHFDKATGRCTFYTTADGLPNNTVYTILTDVDGHVWGSTNRGLFRLNPSTNSIHQFTSKDGLLGDEFNRFQFFSLPDGRMAFGGVDGYVAFDPLEVVKDTFRPNVVLTDIAINNQPADYGSLGSLLPAAINSLTTLELPYTSNLLSFGFAALEYNMPEKLRYSYMLEGFDDNWVNTGFSATAAYTKVPPGHYTLRIRATNTQGEWNPNEKKLAVVILPPFWKTTWFILLCVAIAVGLSWWAIQSRITAIKNKAQEHLAHERKAMELEAAALRAQMNPHFVFNCLNSIKSLIHEDKKREAVLYLTTFSKLIRSQLTNAQREVTLYEELKTCRLYAQLEGLRFANKITVAFHIADGLDLHSVMVPPLIVQPFIENAIWHGILPKEDGGTIMVEVKATTGGIACIVDDNGIGRAISQLNKSPTATVTHQSKGMQLTQERLHLHSRIYHRGSRLEVIDKTDAAGQATGTQVILHLQTDV